MAPAAAALALLACGSSAPKPGRPAEDAGRDSSDDRDDGDGSRGDGNAGDASVEAGGGLPVDASSNDAGDGGAPTERLFVATYLGGISTFAVDPVTGRLEAAPDSPYDVGAQLYAVTVHPSGRFVYATDLRGTVLGYAVTPGTNALTHVPGSPVTIGSTAIAAALDPSGRFLYVGDDQSFHVFAVDAVTGALTATPGSPFDIGGQPATMAFHPSGRFLFASFGSIGPAQNGGIRTFAVDPTSGALTEASGSPFLTDEVRGGGVAVHPSGKFLYVGSFNQLHGFLVDQDTGSLTALSGFPLAGGSSDSTAVDVAVDPSGRYLYASDFAGSIQGYEIDALAGTLTALPSSPFDGRPDPYSVAVDPAGRYLYVGNDDANLLSVFSLDHATGGLTPIAGSPFTVNGLQPEIAVSAGQL